MAVQVGLAQLLKQVLENAQQEDAVQRQRGEDQTARGLSMGAEADTLQEGVSFGQAQHQTGGSGLNLFDMAGAEKYDPGRKVQETKGAVFDAAADKMRGGSGKDTLAGGAGADTMPGETGSGQPKQRNVDEPSFLEDFLSSKLTGETSSARQERKQGSYTRDAADFMAENPGATFEDYQAAGGKAGAGTFKKLKEQGAVSSKAATEASMGEEELERAGSYNKALRNYFASGEDPQHLVGYANTYLAEALGGKLEKLERAEGGGMVATINGKQQPISDDQFRAFLAGDEAVNQNLARTLRAAQAQAFKKLRADGIEEPLAWKTAFGENMPKESQRRIVGKTAKGLPVYEGEEGQHDALYESGLARREPKEAPQQQKVTLADGTEVWVRPGEPRGMPIEGTGKAPEEPKVSDISTGIRTTLAKYGAQAGELPDPEEDFNGFLAAVLSPKSTAYKQMQKAAAEGDQDAKDDLRYFTEAQAAIRSLTLPKRGGAAASGARGGWSNYDR